MISAHIRSPSHFFDFADSRPRGTYILLNHSFNLFGGGSEHKSPLSTIKDKKSLAQEVGQKSDILDRRSKGKRGLLPLQPLLCLQHVQLCHCATCYGSSYTKNEYSLFYQKFDAEYFFIRQFFRQKLYFLIWQFFREKASYAEN